MIRAVLDANTLVSGLLVPEGISKRLIDAAYARTFACISSGAIVAEVMRTLSRDRVRRKYRVAPDDAERLRDFLESDLVSVTITVAVLGVATHPEDDRILEAVISGNADYLVTGDRQLLALGSFRGTEIVTPRLFLSILGIQAPPPP